MDLNKLLLKEINNIIKISKQFDEYFLMLNNLPKNIVDDSNINNIRILIELYMNIRNSHGNIIAIQNKIISNHIFQFDKQHNFNEHNNLSFNISTFNSIITNINELINNIDLEFKKIAMRYPNFINNKILIVLVFVNSNLNINTQTNTQTNIQNNLLDKYEKIISNVKLKYPYNIYKIIKLDSDVKKFKCDKLLNIDLTLKIKELPTIYVINGLNIIEMPMDLINSEQALIDILE